MPASDGGPGSRRTQGTITTTKKKTHAMGNSSRPVAGPTDAPAQGDGAGLAGDIRGASSGSSSTDPAVVVQSNTPTVTTVQNGCPPSVVPWRKKQRSKRGPKARSRCPPEPPTEDWEKEVKEVELIDWEKRTFGLQPYGPEDLISFSQRGSSLPQTAIAILPITAYNPAWRHPSPVKCTSSYHAPLEEGQFEDVDE
ncbi:hypothetical protein NHX12_012111 [Muraenolepis orangiensis]|uniref:Uncharacterized protein n=1 Tax=Muraenolepis orangiensis TaxID=630683 RepID=A0A9Q0I7D6_9TELE|nr:hypothetical protein NHX12_012111 [Muraenolepis orangiensis]